MPEEEEDIEAQAKAIEAYHKIKEEQEPLLTIGMVKQQKDQ